MTDRPREFGARNVNEKWIAYVGPFAFPSGQAASTRVKGVATSLVKAGYRVVVVSGEDRLSTPGRGEFGIETAVVGETAGSGRMRRLLDVLFLWGKATTRYLESQQTRPACVILYGGLTPYALRLWLWCRRHRVPLIVDVVEWYDPRQFKGGRVGPLYLNFCAAFHLLYPRFSGCIAISSLLERHFQEKNIPVIRVPPTMTPRELPHDKVCSHSLHLIYAGTPGAKDLIKLIALAVASANDQGANVVLRVLGLDENEFKVITGRSAIPHYIEVLGRTSQEVALSWVAKSDFSIVVRRSERFTNAGFPTKVVESFACATPVIASHYSDLPQVIRDGENGFLCSAPSVEAIQEKLLEAWRLTPKEYREMSSAARATAETLFNPAAHSSALADLIDTAAEGAS